MGLAGVHLKETPMSIAIGSLVRVTDAVHGDHLPHEQSKHHDGCRFAGMELRVIDADGIEADNGTALAYFLDGAGDQEFFADELEIVV